MKRQLVASTEILQGPFELRIGAGSKRTGIIQHFDVGLHSLPFEALVIGGHNIEGTTIDKMAELVGIGNFVHGIVFA